MGYKFKTKIRVRFVEVDKEGVVHNSNYLNYVEIARVEYLRALGLTWDDVLGMGIIILVAEANVIYKSPAHFDEVLIIEAQISEVRNSSFIFEYRITEEQSGRLVALARTAHVAIDSTTRQPKALPTQLRKLIAGN